MQGGQYRGAVRDWLASKIQDGADRIRCKASTSASRPLIKT